MKGQQRLIWIGPSPARALAVVTSVLAVVMSVLVVVTATLGAVVVLSGCASQSNDDFQRGGRDGAMRPPPGPGVYEIITRLELEPEQLPAVRAVLESAEDEREDIQQEMSSQMSGRPDPSAMASVRARMDDVRERTEDDLSELLTGEQMAEYRKMMDEADRRRDAMRSQMGGRPGGGRGGKGGMRGY